MELMRLVDEDEVDLRSLPSREGLNRAHLNRLVAIGALVDALHNADAMNALGFEGRDGLVDQRERGNRESDALSLVERAPDDMRRQ